MVQRYDIQTNALSPVGEIVIYETQGSAVTVEVRTDGDTVWLNQQQLAALFGRDVKTIGKHIANALRDELAGMVVVAKFATTTPHGAMPDKVQVHQVESSLRSHSRSVAIELKHRGFNQRQLARYVRGSAAFEHIADR